MPDDLFRLYVREMFQIDPLHVRRIASSSRPVARMDQAPTYMPADELNEYKRFMRHYGIVTNIDLIFRHDREIKSGLSVMWTAQDQQPTERDFRLAGDLQPYIQSNLSSHLDVELGDNVLPAIGDFPLTPRETDVAKLICIGRTNAAIATELRIGVATVKTHLIHLFEKTGVKNRSGLVARLSDLM